MNGLKVSNSALRDVPNARLGGNGQLAPVADHHLADPLLLARRDPLAALDDVAAIKRCRRGEAIYGQEDAAECWYRVVSGLLRRFVLRPNGRRQIVDFLLPG